MNNCLIFFNLMSQQMFLGNITAGIISRLLTELINFKKRRKKDCDHN